MSSPSHDEFDFFNLDKYNLDEECLKQPQYYMKYAEKLASANKKVEQAKAAYNVAEAELQKKIRANPDKYCEGDSREGAIKAEITIRLAKHPAAKALIAAKHRQDVLQAAVSALDHRKRALQDLVQLFIAQYFSNPRLKGEDGKDVENKLKQRRAARRTQS